MDNYEFTLPPDCTQTIDSQWTPVQLRSIWAQLELQITPFTEILGLCGELFRSLDDGAKAFIVNSFMLDSSVLAPSFLH